MRSFLKPPYSDGCEGFEYIIKQVDISIINSNKNSIREAVQQVLIEFAELEKCFADLPPIPATIRLERVEQLIQANIQLLGALKWELPNLYKHFLSSNVERNN